MGSARLCTEGADVCPAVAEPRWLTRAEFAGLERELPWHLKAAAQFAVLTGLRMRAMLSLTWQQVDLANKRAWVSGRNMKAGHSLGIPLTPEAIEILKSLPRNGDYVFQWLRLRTKTGTQKQSPKLPA